MLASPKLITSNMSRTPARENWAAIKSRCNPSLEPPAGLQLSARVRQNDTDSICMESGGLQQPSNRSKMAVTGVVSREAWRENRRQNERFVGYWIYNLLLEDPLCCSQHWLTLSTWHGKIKSWRMFISIYIWVEPSLPTHTYTYTHLFYPHRLNFTHLKCLASFLSFFFSKCISFLWELNSRCVYTK